MSEASRLGDRALDDRLRPRRLRQPASDHPVAARPMLDDLLDHAPNLQRVNIQVLEYVRGNPGTLGHEAEEDVLGADVLVVEPPGLLVGQLHYLAGPVREA